MAAINQHELMSVRSADNVPRALSRLRDYYGVSHRTAGAALEMNHETLRARFTGATKCTPDDLVLFADFFGVPVGLLFQEPRTAIRWLLDHPENEESSPAAGLRGRRMSRATTGGETATGC